MDCASSTEILQLEYPVRLNGSFVFSIKEKRQSYSKVFLYSFMVFLHAVYIYTIPKFHLPVNFDWLEKHDNGF